MFLKVRHYLKSEYNKIQKQKNINTKGGHRRRHAQLKIVFTNKM